MNIQKEKKRKLKIMNDKYRQYELSVFDMICNDEYPIDVRVEKTISEEERLPPEFTAHSYQEFLSFFKAVIGANKVNYIIRSLMKRIDDLKDQYEEINKEIRTLVCGGNRK
jgi:hypothetical protein